VGKLDDRSWTLQLDNCTPEVNVGQSSAAIPLLDPGIYRVRVAGTMGGKLVAEEFTATVKPNEVASVDAKKLG
jgi:hypothetical protein